MYHLHSTRFLLQRRLLLRPIPSHLIAVNYAVTAIRDDGWLRSSVCRKRRFFSSESEKRSIKVSASSDQATESRNLEAYTAYVLRSHRVPLGTMSQDEWEDVVSAVNMWTAQTMQINGYAADSAERLLKRLEFEMEAASTNVPNSEQRSGTLKEMRREVLKSWLQLVQKHRSSMKALSRAEAALWNVIAMYIDEEMTSFPSTELFVLLDGWLGLATAQGPVKASELLLRCTDHLYRPYLEEHDASLSVRFDRTIAGLLERVEYTTAYYLSTQLLERMDELKQQDSWNAVELSEATLMALEKASFLHMDEPEVEDSAGMAEEGTKSSLSSFEAEAMTKRSLEVLREAGPGDQKEVERVILRVEAMSEPSEDLLLCLVDYYLRIGDAPNASRWIPTLSTEALLARNHAEGGDVAIIDRLLDAWSIQQHSRAPWRAEEIFRQILDRGNGADGVTVGTVNRLMSIWSKSSDPAAHRKVREWFSRMIDSIGLKPDGTSLHLVLRAIDGNSTASDKLFERILDQWSSWEKDDKQSIADAFIDVFSNEKQLASSAFTLLKRIKSDNLELPRQRYFPLLSKAFFNIDYDAVLQTVENLDYHSSEVDLMIYQAAIHSLIQRDGKQLGTVETLWKQAFERIARSENEPQSSDMDEFMKGVTASYAKWKHYSAGEKFLDEAERLFAADGRKTWPIPLDAYKSLTVRNWYRAETAGKVVQILDRLKSLYQNGYTNVRPDQELYLAHLKATTVLTNEVADLEQILESMVASYEEDPQESCKPHAAAFNVVLLAIKNKTTDPIAAKKATLNVWKRLVDLNVTPDTKTINLVMHSIIKANDAKNTFSSVAQLYRKFGDLDLEPDSHSYHLMISACGTARSEDRDDALELCLQAFGEIRNRGTTTVFTYASLTKALRRLLRGGSIPIADKVATSTLKLCYEDGLLAPEVREAYESIISQGVWKHIYAQHVSDDNREPEKWHRHLPNANSRS